MFEEPEAWEAGFLAGAAFAKEHPDADPKTGLEANPYLPKTEPVEAPEPPPDPLPLTLEPPWQIFVGEPSSPFQDVVNTRAVWDPVEAVYRWKIGDDHQACGVEDVDWLHHRRPQDEAWLQEAVQELSPAGVWVKPVDFGWHLVEGQKCPTIFVSYDWARKRDKAELREFLEKNGWPLRS